jgi:REP element-mobilizing transposase RayT
MIDAATAAFIADFFRRTAARERVAVVALGVVRTHVHMLLSTGPRFDLSRFVQLCKGGSSFAASRLPENKVGLRWAAEYSASTVSPRNLPAAVRYVEMQRLHHPDEVPR